MHGITLVVLAFVGVAVSYAETVKKPEVSSRTVNLVYTTDLK